MCYAVPDLLGRLSSTMAQVERILSAWADHATVFVSKWLSLEHPVFLTAGTEETQAEQHSPLLVVNRCIACILSCRQDKILTRRHALD